ncbi:FMN-binding negative transcriptional regulator [Actinomycetota bacterium Odt1-20B]
MFVPEPFREPDSSWMSDLMRLNPMAIMVSNGAEDGVPYATHLPVIADPEMTGEHGDRLEGYRLVGHMNRENPHWEALQTGSQVLLTFSGPHAYVSPTVYQFNPAAPTWDFTAVHVHGVFQKIEAAGVGEDSMEICKATVTAYEDDFGSGWDMESSIDYFGTILPSVGAFRIEVTEAEGYFKLSQEQEPATRELVLKDFAGRDSTRYQETADLMSRLDPSDIRGGCPILH